MPASMTEVYAYLSDNKANGYTLPEFRTDWIKLSTDEKEYFKTAVGAEIHPT